MTRWTLVVPLALAVALTGCRARDTAPPVATPALTMSAPQVPLGGLVDWTFRFTVAADAPPFAKDYRVLVHVLDADDELMWTDDHDPPVPTSQWVPGRVVEYTRTVFFPIYPYLGPASVQMGLYAGGTEERLPLDGDDSGQRAYRVATIEVLPQDESTFLVYRSGWHMPETAEGTPLVEWQWSRRQATLSMRNMKRDALFYLHADQPETGLPQAQRVAVTMGGQPIDEFTLEPGQEVIRKVPLTVAQLGTADTVEIQMDVDSTFVPAVLAPERSKDARELGIRVFHALVVPR